MNILTEVVVTLKQNNYVEDKQHSENNAIQIIKTTTLIWNKTYYVNIFGYNIYVYFRAPDKVSLEQNRVKENYK